MRLFIALQLNENMKDALCRSRDTLRQKARGGNFSRRENLHLTLAFLGDCPPSALPRIRRAMNAAAQGAKPFSLTLAKPGRFRRGGADLWWVGVQRQPVLNVLAEDLQSALSAEGFSREDRPFAAHLTIARQVDAPGLRPEDLPTEAESQQVSAMSLMESTRSNGVLTYREIFSVSLD